MKQTLTSHDVSALIAEYSQDAIAHNNLTTSELTKPSEELTKPSEELTKPSEELTKSSEESQNTGSLLTTDDTGDCLLTTEDTGGLVGMYLENIYDIDKKTLVLKLKFKTVRKYLLIESGIRMHTIEKFNADGSGAPKSFCVKIRKHIRDRRIVSIKQINHDRVVDIQFGTDDSEPYHMILEFYASGNIILTDKNYLILDLVHYHYYENQSNMVLADDTNLSDDSSDMKKKKIQSADVSAVRPGNTYPFDKACAKKSDHDVDINAVKLWFTNDVLNAPTKRKLKDCIMCSPFKNYSTVIIEHCMMKQGFALKQKVGRGDKLPDFDSEMFINDIKEMLCYFDTLTYPSIHGIVTDTGYYPYEYAHIDLSSAKKFPKFDLSIREWYQRIRGEIESRAEIIPKKTLKKKEKNVDKKEDIVISIKSKITELQNKKGHIANIINLCETNGIFIEIVSDHLRTMHANGYRIDPDDIMTRFTNPMLKIINIKCMDSMKTITFQEILDSSERTPLELVIDWTINVNKNIRNIYSSSKELSNKMIRTEAVMKTLEKKVIKERKIEEISDIKITRKQLWFESYNWFLSSDSYLVVSGKDIKSNEYLVKNIMKDHDIYVHSDLPGSGSCIIINSLKLDVDKIPDRTKEEAGLFVISHTKAWDTDSPNNAFWVAGIQVSKTPETGEYLVPGSFIIRGKRSYIVPQSLIMGFCILFWNGEVLSRSKSSDSKFALISCAPYTSTFECIYKKKVVPGTTKINKAISMITKYFNDIIKSKSTRTEEPEKLISDYHYIKNIPIDDWHRVSPGKVKVM
jgi:predicted ribosome quality control (RQC) complex YloA/Tae2 family protein